SCSRAPTSVALATASSASRVRASSVSMSPPLPGAASGRQGGLGLGYDGLEGSLVAHGQVGQHLAVHADVGLLQARHELAVGDAEGTGAGVDTGDPQGAELTLLDATVRSEERRVGKRGRS